MLVYITYGQNVTWGGEFSGFVQTKVEIGQKFQIDPEIILLIWLNASVGDQCIIRNGERTLWNVNTDGFKTRIIGDNMYTNLKAIKQANANTTTTSPNRTWSVTEFVTGRRNFRNARDSIKPDFSYGKNSNFLWHVCRLPTERPNMCCRISHMF